MGWIGGGIAGLCSVREETGIVGVSVRLGGVVCCVDCWVRGYRLASCWWLGWSREESFVEWYRGGGGCSGIVQLV